MPTILKVVHVLALGSWVGAVLFFAFFTALPIISRMQTLAETPGNWMNFTEKKQGTRAAGEALDAVFARYFPFQVVCAILALAPALWWWSQPGWVPKARVLVIAVGLLLALLNLGYWGPRIHAARLERYADDPVVAARGEATFGALHNVSLAADLLGLVLAMSALAMAVHHPLPPARP
jgi:hypothetical protein